ncbi:MAG TPA: sugar phosphate isomerase/epimerase family protein [Trueperaceae bacterium]
MAFEIGVITDEVAGDFERACELAAAWGLRHVELRTMWGENVLQLSESQLERAERILERLGLTVTAIASPVFKSPLDGKPRAMAADFALGGSESFEEQLELLDRAASLCRRFGTRFVRVFSFWREPWSDEVAADLIGKLGDAARFAREHDVVLAVENEPVCIVGTGEELGRLWRGLEARLAADLLSHLTVLWDPGNAQAAGEDAFPRGYRSLPGGSVGHVHLKDVVRGADGAASFVPVGRGEVGFEQQLRALRHDGYGGQLVLEPHYDPAGVAQAEAAQQAVKAAQQLVEKVLA